MKNDPWTRREVSEVELPDHSYLDAGDRCLFFLEYTAQGGYEASDGNDFISNLKKSVRKKGTPEYKHKLEAIRIAGENLAQEVKSAADRMVLVPIPPSRHRSNPEYDDRMAQVLRTYEHHSKQLGYAPFVLELVEQKADMRKAHESPDDRPSINELMDNYSIRREECGMLRESERKYVYVVDDMLTTGAHFKAMQKTILNVGIPGIKVMGIFLTRRIIPTADETDPPLD